MAMSLTLDQCRQIAADYLPTLFCDAVLYDEPIHSGAYGWVFSYQSEKYIRTGNFGDALVGNSPLLVDRHSADLHVLGSGMPAEFFVANYVACGDPFKTLGKSVELLDARDGAQKTAAIHAIRKTTELSLADAKCAADTCLAGETVVLICISETDAALLTHQLNALGFEANHLRD